VFERENSSTKGIIQEIEVGENESDYKLINVPPLIWSSFQCISSKSAIVCNCASILHDSAEVDLLPIENDKIKYNW
jgi:dTDP-4-dehydrorhamnose 3,5-epimerase-like enzyme